MQLEAAAVLNIHHGCPPSVSIHTHTHARANLKSNCNTAQLNGHLHVAHFVGLLLGIKLFIDSVVTESTL